MFEPLAASPIIIVTLNNQSNQNNHFESTETLK